MFGPILQREMTKFVENVKSDHIRFGQVASGKTNKGYSTRLIDDYRGVVEGYSYVGVLETGRKGGKVPYEFYKIIIKWAEAKGLSFESESAKNRFAYFVSKKIAEEGTKLYRENTKLDIFDKNIKKLEKNLSEAIANQFIVEVENLIFKQ